MLGDWPAYQALCARLTEQAGQSPSPAQSYVLARAGGIGTESGVKADDLVRWGQSGTGAQVSKSEALFGLGLAFYRAGEFAECVARMEEAMRLSPGWSGHAMCWVALALSHDRLRHPDEARAWFTRADGLLTRATAAAQPAAEILPLPQGIPLADWLEFQALYREAKGALGGK
jgi:tetratricopeptide (TPR) repeat protein